MKYLHLTLIQSDLIWEDAEANRIQFSKHISKVKDTDVIILPETFVTGFSMDSLRLAEAMDGKSMQWMAQMADEKEVVICGSLIIQEGERIYNRFIWMKPDGSYEKYDKRHLFRMGDEHLHFKQGKEKVIFEYKGWKICPMICYDLRFPVWSRNDSQFDLLIYVANWPETRITAWEKLLYARAIENQCYVAAVNRIGIDGLGVNCIGNSMLINPKGDQLWKATDQTEEIKTIEISLDSLNAFRKKFPVHHDADSFKIL